MTRMTIAAVVGVMAGIAFLIALRLDQFGMGLNERRGMRKLEVLVTGITERLLMTDGVGAFRISAPGVCAMGPHIAHGMRNTGPMAAKTGAVVVTHPARLAVAHAVSRLPLGPVRDREGRGLGADVPSSFVARRALKRSALLAMAAQAVEHVDRAAQVCAMRDPVMTLRAAVPVGTGRMVEADAPRGKRGQRSVTSVRAALGISDLGEGAVAWVGDVQVHA